MDVSIANWVTNTYGTNKAVAVFWKIITTLGSKWVIFAIIAVLLIFKKTRKMGFYVLCACGAVWVFNDLILKNIVKRLRPFNEYAEFLTMPTLAGLKLPYGYSMASGHAAISMAIAVMTFCYSKKWGSTALIYPFMVGLSRIFLCVHYTTDVMAGWLIGAAIAICVYFVLNWLLKIYLSKKGEKDGKISSSNIKSA